MNNLVEWIMLAVLLSFAVAVVSGYAWRLHRLKLELRRRDGAGAADGGGEPKATT
ncbi:hypothetical protein [Alkalicaulis satelles]|uniref:hypothetical protein n=1 Tax=Alkalicaulis satelles TaxID=2609175 RepID=UPI0018EABF73|nr:hypothetical protein [Alkalicaulis satelles]